MKSQETTSVKKMKSNCESVAAMLKAMGHPKRLMLLCYLAHGEKTVGELEKLCEGSQSSMSQFLKLMKLEGMVASEKRGLFVYYRIFDPKVRLLIFSLHRIFTN